MGHALWSLTESQEKVDNNMIRISQCRESCCRTNTQKKERHKSKRGGERHISKRAEL